MNTKALRQKILDLAIHGKLVQQDPNDEPASVLLERIKAEKERLIKEGKIKRPKRSKAACDKPHYPYELPEGWCVTNIEELLINRDSERKPVSLAVRSKQKIKKYDYYGAAGVIDRVNDYLFNERLLLVGEDGANLLSRNKNNAFFADGKYWVNNHAHVLDATNKGILDFVAMVINSMELDDYITGSAQPKLSQDNLNKIPLPLPPLQEQKRIIKSIDYWFSFVDCIEASKDSLQETIKQTKSKILDLAIHGKLVPQDQTDEPASQLLKRINPKAEIACDNAHYRNLPKGWAEIKVGNVAEYTNGRAFKPEEWESVGLPIIRIQNLNDADAHYNRSSIIHEHKYLVKDGDLLFAWAASLGTYIWNGGDAWLNQHIFKVEPFSFIDKTYLFYVFQSMISEFYRNSHGSGMVHITKKQFEEITLLLPPLSEQYRIVEFLERTLNVLDSINCNF